MSNGAMGNYVACVINIVGIVCLCVFVVVTLHFTVDLRLYRLRLHTIHITFTLHTYIIHTVRRTYIYTEAVALCIYGIY